MMNILTIQQNYQRAPDYFINPSFKYDAFPPPILYKSFYMNAGVFLSPVIEKGISLSVTENEGNGLSLIIFKMSFIF